MAVKNASKCSLSQPCIRPHLPIQSSEEPTLNTEHTAVQQVMNAKMNCSTHLLKHSSVKELDEGNCGRVTDRGEEAGVQSCEPTDRNSI